MKIVYTYNNETKYFLEKHNCQPDPIEGGWLYPANNYTEIEPLFENGKIPKFINQRWDLVDDCRGIWYFRSTGEKVNIDSIETDTSSLTRIEKPAEYYEWEKNNWVENATKRYEYEIKRKNDLIIEQLSKTDSEMSRKLEEHVDLLISKKLVSLTDYSEEFQEIYNLKKELRSQIL